jgi:hypothetical protein
VGGLLEPFPQLASLGDPAMQGLHGKKIASLSSAGSGGIRLSSVIRNVHPGPINP